MHFNINMNVIIGIRGSVHFKISIRIALFVQALIYVSMFVLLLVLT